MKENLEESIVFLLADDHNIVRQGVKMILEDCVENAVIYQASTLHQIEEQIKTHKIDFAILDAQYPDGNCIHKIAAYKTLLPHLKILIFSSFEEETYALKYANAGADGYISKLCEEEEIEESIQRLITQGTSFSPYVEQLIAIQGDNKNLFNPLHQLSDREIEIAHLYANGLGNLEIANTLDIKQNTVSTYKKRIFDKLKIDTMLELIELVKKHAQF